MSYEPRATSRELGFPKVHLKISLDEKSNSLTSNELAACGAT